MLIDHILVSDSLKPGATFKSFDLGAISDHRAVIAHLKE
jgi:endonuclease/exonuclease/phosphatase family metal-dependent hydrolase